MIRSGSISGEGTRVLIAGAGIAGLAGALACARQGIDACVFEKADQLSEVGAGIQLGPNAMRLLRSWLLESSLRYAMVFPQRLMVRDALSGQELAALTLGQDMELRYGAPYGVIHRADLQNSLRRAVQATGVVGLELGAAVTSFQHTDQGIALQFVARPDAHGSVLIGADGLWSQVRHQLNADGQACPTGHLAYRALIAQSALPASLRSQDVAVWLAPGSHMVHYPVHAGESLNIVLIVEGGRVANVRDWDQAVHAEELRSAVFGQCAAVQDLVAAVPHWRCWSLCDRPAVRSPTEIASERVALIGDAAHPMLPYLAQGAAMGMEDAQALVDSLVRSRQAGFEDASALSAYALQRWQRQARVQRRAWRNGRIFHASGPLAWGRNFALRLLGSKLLDMPWLYGDTNAH